MLLHKRQSLIASFCSAALLICIVLISVFGIYKLRTSVYHKSLYQIIQSIYDEHNFPGKFVPLKVKRSYLPDNTTNVDYYYSEMIDGREIKFSQSLTFERRTKQIVQAYRDKPYVTNNNYQNSLIFKGIGTVAFQQPQGIDIVKQVDDVILPVLNWKNFEYVKTELSFNNALPDYQFKEVTVSDSEEDITRKQLLADDFAKITECYEQDVKNNQENNLPFKGYYNIDVENYLKKGLFQINLDYKLYLEVDGDYDKKRNQNASFHEKLDNQFKTIDFSKLPDGNYLISYELHTERGYSRSIENVIKFNVIDGKLVAAIDQQLGDIMP